MSRILFFRIYVAAALVAFSGCEEPKKPEAKLKIYGGPIMTAKNIATVYSDSGKTKLIISGPLQLQYNDGDREFPKGIRVDFFDSDGDSNAVLTANYARFDKATDIHLALGNVIIFNKKERRKLNTEELRWNRSTRKVYTDKFVRIETPTEILTGHGLTANQDFSWYRITKPTGVFSSDTLL